MSEAKLKPCPFCGGEARAGKREEPKGDLYAVCECTQCCAETPVAVDWHGLVADELPKAIAAWNRRADPLADEGVREVDQAAAFDKADWFWRTMDPDDCGDTPEEAINRSMVGLFCVCEVASSYAGPTRYGFIAPTLHPESDEDEFVHFGTQREAIDAAKERAALAAIKEGGEG